MQRRLINFADSEDINRFVLKMLDNGGFWKKLLEYYGYLISGNVGVVGCAYIYLKEEELQENYLKNLTHIPEVCSQQRLEEYKDERL